MANDADAPDQPGQPDYRADALKELARLDAQDTEDSKMWAKDMQEPPLNRWLIAGGLLSLIAVLAYLLRSIAMTGKGGLP